MKRFAMSSRAGHQRKEKVSLVAQQNASANGSDDHRRFANVVLPHLDDAYTLAVWLTGNRADAEDVVHDACLHASRAINSFARGSARAWILTITRHSAHSWLRKNRPAELVVVADAEAVEPARSVADNAQLEPPEAPLAKRDAACLQASIAALPTPFRETVVLREVQGLSYHEIAHVTEVPMGTVVSRLARGRRRLIAAMGK
jgi:RNA polymerase sigma factor (sigma-70 family)